MRSEDLKPQRIEGVNSGKDSVDGRLFRSFWLETSKYSVPYTQQTAKIFVDAVGVFSMVNSMIRWSVQNVS